MSIYSSYFNLSENPFGETPDSRFFFESTTHRAALSKIESAFSKKTSLTLLTGEVGSGKTLLSRVLIGRRSKQEEIALILNPLLGPAELVRAFGEELHALNGIDTLQESLTGLESRLAESSRLGKATVLMIDEAQWLPKKSIDALMKISAYAEHKNFLLHILFLGQSELSNSPTLKDKTAISLDSLSQQEMKRYIAFRLERVGSVGFCTFEDSALAEIFERSRGLPRLVNRFCELALLMAERKEQRQIDKKLVQLALNHWPQLDMAAIVGINT